MYYNIITALGRCNQDIYIEIRVSVDKAHTLKQQYNNCKIYKNSYISVFDISLVQASCSIHYIYAKVYAFWISYFKKSEGYFYFYLSNFLLPLLEYVLFVE